MSYEKDLLCCLCKSEVERGDSDRDGNVQEQGSDEWVSKLGKERCGWLCLK